jgi:hypothetical protein
MMASGRSGTSICCRKNKAISRGVSVLTKKTYLQEDLCEGFYCWQSY